MLYLTEKGNELIMGSEIFMPYSHCMFTCHNIKLVISSPNTYLMNAIISLFWTEVIVSNNIPKGDKLDHESFCSIYFNYYVRKTRLSYAISFVTVQQIYGIPNGSIESGISDNRWNISGFIASIKMKSLRRKLLKHIMGFPKYDFFLTLIYFVRNLRK